MTKKEFSAIKTALIQAKKEAYRKKDLTAPSVVDVCAINIVKLLGRIHPRQFSGYEFLKGL